MLILLGWHLLPFEKSEKDHSDSRRVERQVYGFEVICWSGDGCRHALPSGSSHILTIERKNMRKIKKKPSLEEPKVQKK